MFTLALLLLALQLLRPLIVQPMLPSAELPQHNSATHPLLNAHSAMLVLSVILAPLQVSASL